ncbi:MAG TPA: nucleotidyltransferase domain-containing protein [Thermoanaerobaculia bacterium]|nr:nucleotidyltransferase domain-containing protein [Thermoanaerobaculia bacterium]
MPEMDLRLVSDLARSAPGLELLLLFGSRARGDAHSGSDWDFSYLAGAVFDPDDFLARLVLGLKTDRIDLVNLRRTSGLLRYRVAAEGQPIFEKNPGNFERFWFKAVSFWWDMGPIFKAGYEEILQDLEH